MINFMTFVSIIEIGAYYQSIQITFEFKLEYKCYQC